MREMEIVFSLLWSLVPLLLIGWIIYRVMNRRHAGTGGHGLSLHDGMRAIVGFTAVMIGWYAVYNLPAFLGQVVPDEDNAFAIRLVAAVALIIVGAIIRKLTGLILMLSGLLAVLASLSYVFDNFGSGGMVLIISAALLAVVGLTVYFHRQRESPRG